MQKNLFDKSEQLIYLDLSTDNLKSLYKKILDDDLHRRRFTYRTRLDKIYANPIKFSDLAGILSEEFDQVHVIKTRSGSAHNYARIFFSNEDDKLMFLLKYGE